MKSLTLLVLVGGVACGPSSWDDFRSQLVKVSCQRDVKCGAIGANELPVCEPAPQLLAFIQPLFADVDQAIKNGSLRYNSSGAQDCLDAVSGADCDLTALSARVTLHCHNVIQPNALAGKPCRTDGECEGGQCVIDPTGCGGSCVGFPQPGSPCTPGSSDPGMACDPTVQYCGLQNPPDGGVPDGGVAGPTVCLRHKQRGDTCLSDDECSYDLFCLGTCGDLPRMHDGDLCTSPGTLCDDGVYCATTGKCTAEHKADQPCDSRTACQKGLACVGFSTGAMNVVVPGTCKPWLDIGLPCNASPPTGPSTVSGCPDSQECMKGTCMASNIAPRLAFDQPCAVGDRCGIGLYCDGMRCRFAARLGGDCAKTSLSCDQGLTCNGSQRCESGATCP